MAQVYKLLKDPAKNIRIQSNSQEKYAGELQQPTSLSPNRPQKFLKQATNTQSNKEYTVNELLHKLQQETQEVQPKVFDFKKEIENRFAKSQANKFYKFPRHSRQNSNESVSSSVESLRGVTVYNLK